MFLNVISEGIVLVCSRMVRMESSSNLEYRAMTFDSQTSWYVMEGALILKRLYPPKKNLCIHIMNMNTILLWLLYEIYLGVHRNIAVIDLNWAPKNKHK